MKGRLTSKDGLSVHSLGLRFAENFVAQSFSGRKS